MSEQYGDDAEFHAAQRADQLFEQGDIDGFNAWVEIKKRVELLNLDPEQSLN